MPVAYALVEQGIERRKQIMAFIRSYRKQFGYSPSVQEIADGVGYSTKSSVRRHVDILKAEGRLEETPGRYRSLRPIVKPRKVKI